MICFDLLHKDFNTITTNFLKVSYKIINQIQSILQSKKGKNICKQATKGGISDLTMAFKDKSTRTGKAISEISIITAISLATFKGTAYY